MSMEIDFDVLVTANDRSELEEMQKKISFKDTEGNTYLDLNQILPEPKEGEANPYGDLKSWRKHKWETTKSKIPCTGLEPEDIFYNGDKDFWQVKLSLHADVLSIIERLANMYIFLDFVVTMYTRDGGKSEHFEYCLTRTFYNSVYEMSTVGGSSYKEVTSADGEKTVIRDTEDDLDDDFIFSERDKEEEPSSDEGEGTDIEF